MTVPDALLRAMVAEVKSLPALRDPPYELPADSHIERVMRKLYDMVESSVLYDERGFPRRAADGGGAHGYQPLSRPVAVAPPPRDPGGRSPSEARDAARLRALAEMILDFVNEPPDRNCSCHISPPCIDCVENSGLRELFEAARAALGPPGPPGPAGEKR